MIHPLCFKATLNVNAGPFFAACQALVVLSTADDINPALRIMGSMQ